MEIFLEYAKAFLVGGALCAVGQVLIDYTKLTPARILVGFVTLGVVLTAVGLYEPLVQFAGGGATVPLTGSASAAAAGIRPAAMHSAKSAPSHRFSFVNISIHPFDKIKRKVELLFYIPILV